MQIRSAINIDNRIFAQQHPRICRHDLQVISQEGHSCRVAGKVDLWRCAGSGKNHPIQISAIGSGHPGIQGIDVANQRIDRLIGIDIQGGPIDGDIKICSCR